MTINIGVFIDNLISLLIIAVAAFMIVKAVNGLRPQEEEPLWHLLSPHHNRETADRNSRQIQEDLATLFSECATWQAFSFAAWGSTTLRKEIISSKGAASDFPPVCSPGGIHI